MPCGGGDGDEFCLATPLMSHGLRLQDETGRASASLSAALEGRYPLDVVAEDWWTVTAYVDQAVS